MLHLNTFSYSRERRRFGRQCLFTDRSELMLSIRPSAKHRVQFIMKNPIDCVTQLSSQMAYSTVETENVTLTEHGMNHFEGGWPRDLNIHDEEQTVRYRKKVERDDNWGPQVGYLIRSAVVVAQQNSAVNIYEEFFVDLPPELGLDIRLPFEARQTNVFHDPVRPGRPIVLIDWAPTTRHKILALHTIIPDEEIHAGEFEDEDSDGSSNAFYVWDKEKPLKPSKTLDCNEPVRIALYCPRDENYVAGGVTSGKVTVWDTQGDANPLRITPLEAAHREVVTSLCWVHSKSNTEFYTGSLDGAIKYWDGRDLNQCIHEILLDPEFTDEQQRDRAHGVAVLEFEYTIPVRYIVASVHGHVFVGNRKGMVPTETLLANYKLFSGVVHTIQRNPFFVKNFLITGDWCARVWAEENKGSPSTLLIKKKNQILCGAWSPSRCSLFVTGDTTGELDFWDLLLNHRKPIFSLKYKQAVTSTQFRVDGEYLGVGLADGDVHLLEMDRAMRHSGGKEKALMAALFEREQLRCKLLEGRVEEMKLRRRTTALAEEQKLLEEEAALEKASEEDLDPEDPEQFLQIIENDEEFKEALHNFNDIVTKLTKLRRERDHIMEMTEFEKKIPEHERKVQAPPPPPPPQPEPEPHPHVAFQKK